MRTDTVRDWNARTLRHQGAGTARNGCWDHSMRRERVDIQRFEHAPQRNELVTLPNPRFQESFEYAHEPHAFELRVQRENVTCSRRLTREAEQTLCYAL